MATNYNSKRILDILKIAAWKATCSLEYKSFAELAKKINADEIQHLSEDLPEITQKYLSELYLDAKKGIETDKATSKNELYIHRILNYLSYTAYSNFETDFFTITDFIQVSKIDFSQFTENKIAVFHADDQTKTINKVIPHFEKHLSAPLSYIPHESKDLTIILETLADLCAKFPFVVWLVSNEWNQLLADQSSTEKLRILLENGQLIPIRLGDNFAENNLIPSFLAQPYCPSGEIGIGMALLAIDDAITPPSIEDKKISPLGARTKIDTLNNSGTILSIEKQEIKGENIVFGNMTQHIHKKDQ